MNTVAWLLQIVLAVLFFLQGLLFTVVYGAAARRVEARGRPPSSLPPALRQFIGVAESVRDREAPGSNPGPPTLRSRQATRGDATKSAIVPEGVPLSVQLVAPARVSNSRASSTAREHAALATGAAELGLIATKLVMPAINSYVAGAA